jgi:hypothetical protein
MKRDNIRLPAASRLEELKDRIDSLEADLDSVVEIAYLRGATEWVRLHYPSRYERLHRQFDSSVI